MLCCPNAIEGGIRIRIKLDLKSRREFSSLQVWPTGALDTHANTQTPDIPQNFIQAQADSLSSI